LYKFALAYLNLKEGIMFSFANDFGDIKHHKSSFHGAIIDYIISFVERQYELTKVRQYAYELIQELIKFHNERRINARLVAKVIYRRIKYDDEDVQESTHTIYFPSSQSEEIVDIDDFLNRHIDKIGERILSFNKNGSNLLFDNIEHIFIEMSLIGGE
jgi:hypothetical protein